MKKIKLKYEGEMKMSENNNVRLGLIELYKNKVRFLGFTQKDLDEMIEALITADRAEKLKGE